MKQDDRDLHAYAEAFNILGGGDEAVAALEIIAEIWQVPDDDAQLTMMVKRLGFTLSIVADIWREKGIPEIPMQWAKETPA